MRPTAGAAPRATSGVWFWFRNFMRASRPGDTFLASFAVLSMAAADSGRTMGEDVVDVVDVDVLGGWPGALVGVQALPANAAVDGEGASGVWGTFGGFIEHAGREQCVLETG